MELVPTDKRDAERAFSVCMSAPTDSTLMDTLICARHAVRSWNRRTRGDVKTAPYDALSALADHKVAVGYHEDATVDSPPCIIVSGNIAPYGPWGRFEPHQIVSGLRGLAEEVIRLVGLRQTEVKAGHRVVEATYGGTIYRFNAKPPTEAGQLQAAE